MSKFDDTSSTIKPKISIGMPVYNGERFMRRMLNCILSQTFRDFELIISDNASTDSTALICEEYGTKDSRIRYVRQANNMGMIWNFEFVLKQARFAYFVWAAVDDMWHSDFLKKNIEVLQSNKNLIGSCSRVNYFDSESQKPQMDELSVKKIYSGNKIEHFFGRILVPQIHGSEFFSMSGSLEKKVELFLKKLDVSVLIYGVYRVDILRESYVTESFIANDWAISLNLLKHGEIYLIQEDLMFRYSKGTSSSTRNFVHALNISPTKIIFRWFPFTLWCLKNLGLKIFLKNLDYFFLLNYKSIGLYLSEFYLRRVKHVDV